MAKEQTSGKYQCGSCEQFFNELKNSECPHCGSGNWIEGCIDDAEKSIEEDKPVSMKPDNTLVNELRDFSKKVKDEVVLFPQCTFKEAVDKESDNGKPFVPVNLGEILHFIADMMER